MPASALEEAACRHLNEQHKQQVIEYLKYFRAKRDQHVHEIQRTFDEVKDTRLLDELYTHDDVAEIIESLRTLLKSNVADELENFSHTSVLFLRQLLLQAEGQHVQLRIDTFKLDDEVLLNDIDKMDLEATKESSINLLTNLPTPSKPRLGAIGAAPIDTNLVTQLKDVKAENEQYQRRIETLREQLATITESNKSLNNKIKAQEESLKIYQEQQAHDDSSSIRDELIATKTKLAEVSRSLDAKVSATPQFQELKRFVTKKNAQIKQMRARLGELDPGFTLTE